MSVSVSSSGETVSFLQFSRDSRYRRRTPVPMYQGYEKRGTDKTFVPGTPVRPVLVPTTRRVMVNSEKRTSTHLRVPDGTTSPFRLSGVRCFGSNKTEYLGFLVSFHVRSCRTSVCLHLHVGSVTTGCGRSANDVTLPSDSEPTSVGGLEGSSSCMGGPHLPGRRLRPWARVGRSRSGPRDPVRSRPLLRRPTGDGVV